jgi:quercetin dioxygenase-like cupin family protein
VPAIGQTHPQNADFHLQRLRTRRVDKAKPVSIIFVYGKRGFHPERGEVTQRNPDVQAFLDGVRAGYEASGMDADTRRCIEAVFAALDASAGPVRPGGFRQPACTGLPAALGLARSAGRDFTRIPEAFERVEPLINWTRRSSGPNASANIMDGHANAMVVGPGGLEERADVHVGLTIMSPQMRYFDHSHAPEEAYLVLTPGEFRQGGDGKWFEPGVGGSFYNPPNILHAMRTGDMPMFAVWCLRRA